jgi:hypothetical protein
MLNTVLSSKHTKELRNGRRAEGDSEKSKSKFYGKDTREPEETKAALVGD